MINHFLDELLFSKFHMQIMVESFPAGIPN